MHEAADGLRAEPGTIADVAYAGMVTRFKVALHAGGELQVVRQNLETTSQDALDLAGRKVRVAWAPAHEYVINEGVA